MTAAVDLLFVMKRHARPGELVKAYAWIKARAEPPGATGYRRLAMIQAEGWRGLEAPALLERLFLPDWTVVESVLPQPRLDRDSWSWRRT